MERVRRTFTGLLAGLLLLAALAFAGEPEGQPRPRGGGNREGDGGGRRPQGAGRRGGDERGEPKPRERRDWQKIMQERQRQRIERLRRTLDVKTDEEWEIIKAKIEAVEKLREPLNRIDQMGGMFLMVSHMKKLQAKQQGGEHAERFERMMDMYNKRHEQLAKESPELAEMVTAIQALADFLVEETAMDEEIKQKLAEYRQKREEVDAELEKRRQELAQILSVKQRAVLVVNGILQ